MRTVVAIAQTEVITRQIDIIPASRLVKKFKNYLLDRDFWFTIIVVAIIVTLCTQKYGLKRRVTS